MRHKELAMKRTMFAVAAVAAILIPAAGPTLAATKVFLLGGQSNMDGLGNFGGGTNNSVYYPPDPLLPTSPYYPPQTNVHFWNGSGWVALQKGFGYQGTGFGPELSFGYRIKQLYPNDEIYLVKWGISGSSLATDWNPDVPGGKMCYELQVAGRHGADESPQLKPLARRVRHALDAGRVGHDARRRRGGL
jgi:hypothetical protein